MSTEPNLRNADHLKSYRPETARFTDRSIVMNDGEIIETGMQKSIMSQRGFYYQLNLVENHKKVKQQE